MKNQYELSSLPSGGWRVREVSPEGELLQETPMAFPVSEVCRRLRKSRRQIYRYLQKGWLESAGKFLNEWLITESSLERLKALGPSARRRLPVSAKHLLAEYRPQDIDPIRHAVTIAGHIMDRGGLREAKWLLATYPTVWLKDFLKQHGPRLLSHRSLVFWCRWFHIDPIPTSWRTAGRLLGGVGR